MEVTLLIQSINESIQNVNGQIGDIREFQGRTVSRIEDIAKDVNETVQQHNNLCVRVDALERYRDDQKVGVKTTIVITGAISGLIGAVGGALGIVFILYQLGSMMGGTP